MLAAGLFAMVGLSAMSFLPRPSGTNEPFQVEQQGCPTSPITITGCVIKIDGCYFIRTATERVFVNLFNYPGIKMKDHVTVSGSFVTDADCSNCVLNPTSVTVLGRC